MHLCRGNCLSQVLPGIFIVSPDTEYSAPLSDVGCGAGGAVTVSAAWASFMGGKEQGKEADAVCVCVGGGELGVRALDFQLQLIAPWHILEWGLWGSGTSLGSESLSLAQG